MIDGVPRLKVLVCYCRCSEDGDELTFTRIPSRHGVDYITLSCKMCGTQTRLCRSAKIAVSVWNDHFGPKAKKHSAEWDFGGHWEQFL